MQSLNLMPERIIYLEFHNSSIQQYNRKDFRKTVQKGINEILKCWQNNLRVLLLNFNNKFESQDIIINEIGSNIINYCHNKGFLVDFFSKSMLDQLISAGVNFERKEIISLNDAEFIEYIRRFPQNYALYVEGGILRESILGTHIRFIHIHPGLVPEMRGTLCLLWSAIVLRKIGGSCMFLDKGIDTGDIIYQKEYAVPKIPISQKYLSEKFLYCQYKSLEDYLDPIIRADVFRSLLERYPNPSEWATMAQGTSGKQYYHPHPALRDKMVSLFYEKINKNQGE
jgi:hypothetical protein